jgi:hypothetical protein
VELLPVAELVEGGVLVAGVPQHDGVDDEAEGAELVFLPFARMGTR